MKLDAWTVAVLLVSLLIGCAWGLAGCGGVTTEQLGPEGGPQESGAEARTVDGPPADSPAVDAGTEHAAAPDSLAPSCNVEQRCAACAPYPCAAVVACALSGDAGAYPWQSCHNLNAAPADVDGLHCAMRAACP